MAEKEFWHEFNVVVVLQMYVLSTPLAEVPFSTLQESFSIQIHYLEQLCRRSLVYNLW